MEDRKTLLERLRHKPDNEEEQRRNSFTGKLIVAAVAFPLGLVLGIIQGEKQGKSDYMKMNPPTLSPAEEAIIKQELEIIKDK